MNNKSLSYQRFFIFNFVSKLECPLTFDVKIRYLVSSISFTAMSGLMKQNPLTLNVFCILNRLNPASKVMSVRLRNVLVCFWKNGFKLIKLWKNLCMSTCTNTSKLYMKSKAGPVLAGKLGELLLWIYYTSRLSPEFSWWPFKFFLAFFNIS